MHNICKADIIYRDEGKDIEDTIYATSLSNLFILLSKRPTLITYVIGIADTSAWDEEDYEDLEYYQAKRIAQPAEYTLPNGRLFERKAAYDKGEEESDHDKRFYLEFVDQDGVQYYEQRKDYYPVYPLTEFEDMMERHLYGEDYFTNNHFDLEAYYASNP